MAPAIVPVTEELLSAAGAVHALAWQDSHRAICSPEFLALHTPERQTAYLRAELARGKAVFLLTDEAGPGGVVSLWDGLIENLYVLPERQGRGYGRALLRFAIARCESPRLWVLSTNDFAYSWYLRSGFFPTGAVQRLSDTLFEREMRYGGPPRHVQPSTT